MGHFLSLLDNCRAPYREATNLAARVLGWMGVLSCFRNVICHASGMQFVMLQECNLSHFRNATKGVACAQTSVPFRNAIKPSLQKSCVHLHKFIILSAEAAWIM